MPTSGRRPMRTANYDFVLSWSGVNITEPEIQALLSLRVAHSQDGPSAHLCTEDELEKSLAGYGKGKVAVTRAVNGREVTYSITAAP